MIQKYLNFQFSVSMDLFGSEQSTNAGNYYSSGLKGRWQETRRKDDHVLLDDTRTMRYVEDGEIREKEVPMLSRAQPRPARRVRRRLRQRRTPLEPGARGRRPRGAAASCRTRASTAGSASTPATTSAPEGEVLDRRRSGQARVGRLAAVGRGPRRPSPR